MLTQLLKQYRRQLLSITILTMVNGLVAVGVLAFINKYLLHLQAFSWGMLILFLVILVAYFCFSQASMYILAKHGDTFINALRKRLVKQVLDSSVENLQHLGKARILASLSGDIRNLVVLFMRLPEVLKSLIYVLGVSLYLVSLNLPLFLLTAGLMALLIVVGRSFHRRVYQHQQQTRLVDNTLYSDYQLILDGHRELLLNRARAKTFYEESFSAHTDQALQAALGVSWWQYLHTNFSNTLVLAIVGLDFFFALGLEVANLETALTFALAMLFLRGPLMTAINSANVLSQGKVAYDSIVALSLPQWQEGFDESIDQSIDESIDQSIDKSVEKAVDKSLDESVDKSPDKQKVPQRASAAKTKTSPTTPILTAEQLRNWKTIRFAQVTYQYKQSPTPFSSESFGSAQGTGQRQRNRGVIAALRAQAAKEQAYREQHAHKVKPFALEPVNLTITRGQTLFIIGKNGSGKSTLSMLLAGLYQPTGGRIYLDEIDITEHWSSYRRLISAVFSDFYLFDTVIDAEGKLLADEGEFNHLLEVFEIEGKVQISNGKLSTTHLSMGQRKRLALILALLEKRSLLILDEWAADQDPTFRRKFYRELVPAFKAQGITVVAISHDDLYFDVAEAIVVVRQGQVSGVEVGKQIDWAQHVEAEHPLAAIA